MVTPGVRSSTPNGNQSPGKSPSLAAYRQQPPPPSRCLSPSPSVHFTLPLPTPPLSHPPNTLPQTQQYAAQDNPRTIPFFYIFLSRSDERCPESDAGENSLQLTVHHTPTRRQRAPPPDHDHEPRPRPPKIKNPPTPDPPSQSQSQSREATQVHRAIRSIPPSEYQLLLCGSNAAGCPSIAKRSGRIPPESNFAVVLSEPTGCRNHTRPPQCRPPRPCRRIVQTTDTLITRIINPTRYTEEPTPSRTAEAGWERHTASRHPPRVTISRPPRITSSGHPSPRGRAQVSPPAIIPLRK